MHPLVLSTPYPGAASLPRTAQAPHTQSISNVSPPTSAAGVVPTFNHSRHPTSLSVNSPWPPSGNGWVNGGVPATHRTTSSMGPVIPNFPLPPGRRQKNRKRRSSTGESGSASSSSHSSDRRRRSRRNPMPAPPRDIAKDRARELHEAEQAVNAAKKVREVAQAEAVATVEADAYRRAGIQVAPIPNTSAVALSSQASLLPGVQYSAPFASSSSHLGHGQPTYDHSVERHNSQPVFTYGNIGKSKPSKGISALFRRKSAPPKPIVKDRFPQPPNMPPSNMPPWNGYSFVPPPVQDPSKPLILMAGVPPPDGYRAVAFGTVPQHGPAPTPRNVPDIPMPPETTDVPVDEDPVIPNLKSGGNARHYTRRPTLHESTSVGPIITDPAQVAYIPAGATPSMVNLADPTDAGGIVGGQHFPWPGERDWPEQRQRPKKRSIMSHIKDWTNGTELSSHPDAITTQAVYSNIGAHPAAMDLMKRKKSQSKEKLDLLADDDETVDHRQASYDQLTRGRQATLSFATTGGGGSGSRSKLKPVYFSENRGHDLYPFCMRSEHPISWGGATGATALHWYESGRFESAGYGLGTDGMENDARPSEWIKNRGTTRGLMRLLTNADKERSRKEVVELTRAATEESRIVLAAQDIDALISLSNGFKSKGRERSDWDSVWRPKVRSTQLLAQKILTGLLCSFTRYCISNLHSTKIFARNCWKLTRCPSFSGILISFWVMVWMDLEQTNSEKHWCMYAVSFLSRCRQRLDL